MIWLTWRQFRMQLLVVGAAVAAAAVVLAITGPGLAEDFRQLGASFIANLSYQTLHTQLHRVGIVLLYLAPPVIGAFWGAPLISRELETGTHRLVWTQSVGRTRWLVVKVGLTGLAAVAVTGLLSLAVTWWSDPIDTALNSGQDSNNFLPRLYPSIFSGRALVPVGYAAFAFALGVAVGLVVRRTLVALAITLAAVVLVQVLTPTLLRPQLLNPVVTHVTLTKENLRGLQISGPEANPQVVRLEAAIAGPGNWKTSEVTVDKSGKAVSVLPNWVIQCGGPTRPNAQGETQTTQAACFQRLADEGYQQRITYVPANRFWDLQWRETGLFMILALGLLGFSFWRIRRDFS